MKNEELRKATKDKIFVEAAELFSRYGYYKVSVREICEAAGVTKPVLYYYFIDKENLLLEMVKETRKIIERLIERWITPALTIEEKLEGIVQLYLEFIAQYPHLVKFSTFTQFMVVPESVKKFRLEQGGRSWYNLIKIFEEAQRDGSIDKNIDVIQLARNFIGSIMVIFSEYITGSVEIGIDEINKELIKFLTFWKQQFLISKN